MPELIELAWDSEFFGFGVAHWIGVDNLDFRKISQDARASGIRLVYLFLPPDSAADRSAREAGVRLVDRKVTFVTETAISGPISPHVQQVSQMTARMRELALQSGVFSRFRLDDNLPAGSFEKMYSLWLDRSLRRANAREVLAYEEAGQQLGMITLGEKNGRADIGLLGVHDTARGRGIGSLLVHAARGRAAEMGYGRIQVATQLDNAPACALYQRSFLPENVEHIYHFWVS